MACLLVNKQPSKENSRTIVVDSKTCIEMNQESVVFALAQSIPEPQLLGDTAEVKLFGSQVKQLMKAGVALAEEDISGLGTWSSSHPFFC